MSSTTSSPGLQSRKTRGRTACKPCRQAKVKCGLEQIPCLRCQRKGIECSWDPGFKRTKNKDRVAELEANIKNLRSTLGEVSDTALSHGAGDPLVSTPTSSLRQHNGNRQRLPNRTGYSRTPIGEDSPQVELREKVDMFSVLDVKLNSRDAETMFGIFFDRYHVYAPFLDPGRHFETYYRSSNLLFWTIISVAARESQPEKDFLARLSPYFTTSFGHMVFGAPLRLPQIQALLLLSLWPCLNVHWWTDRSLTLSHLAVMSAVQLGLNNPHFESEYTNEKVSLTDEGRLERTRTWVACLVISQIQAMDFGVQTKLPFDNWIISNICNNDSTSQIPTELLHNLMIQRLNYFAFEAISHCVSPDTGLYNDIKLAELLDKYSFDLSTLAQPDWSLSNRLRLATVKLHLQCMYLHLDPSHTARKNGIVQAYATSTDVVNMVLAEEGSTEILSYSPRTTLRMLILASCTIFKVLHSSYVTEVDRQSGKTLYNAAALCIRLQAVQYQEKDQPMRMKDLFRELWQAGDADEGRSSAAAPVLSVKTRLGSSVIYDSLNVWRKWKRGESSLNTHDNTGNDTRILTSNAGSAPESDVDFGGTPLGFDFNTLLDDYMWPWGESLGYNDPFIVS